MIIVQINSNEGFDLEEKFPRRLNVGHADCLRDPPRSRTFLAECPIYHVQNHETSNCELVFF